MAETTRDEIAGIIIAILAYQLELPEEIIAEEHDLVNDLGMDAESAKEIFRSIQAQLGVTFRSDDPKPKTVKELIDFVHSLANPSR